MKKENAFRWTDRGAGGNDSLSLRRKERIAGRTVHGIQNEGKIGFFSPDVTFFLEKGTPK